MAVREKTSLSSTAEERRFLPEVEALRGVAAMAVLVFHTFLTRPVDATLLSQPSVDGILTYIATTLFNGTGAVILFFVISGFVLGCNISARTELTARFYGAFAIRRIFRIMPALWLSLAFAALFNPISLRQALHAMVISQEALKLNGPLWSLQVEMWISAIFPFMFFAARGMGAFGATIVLLVLSRITYVGWVPSVWMLYIFCFQLGILVPTVGRSLVAATGSWRFSLFLLSLAGLLIPTNVSNLGYMRMPDHTLIEGFASFFLLSFVVYGGHVEILRFLRSQVVRFLGAISYSVYLFHFPVISLVKPSIAPLFGGNAAAREHSFVFGLVCIGPVLGLTLLLAWLSYRLVEKPTHAYGKALARLLTSEMKLRDMLRPRVKRPGISTD